MQRIIEPAADGKPQSWGTLRSVHATEGHIYPKSIAYVVTQDGAKIIAGRDAPSSAISALHRNANAAEHNEVENNRRAWVEGKRAA